MLTSKAFILGTVAFAIFSIYAIFFSLYQTQLKFEDTSDINPLSQGNSTSWFQPKVKVAFVIVDGLRFDYLLNYKNIDRDPALQVNKFNKFNQKYFDNPDKFVVLRAFADLPTMTVLRVPTLMTGNVPRLGSVLTAFGALPATEDSIPRQLYLQGKKSYFTGDPILKEYFPKYFKSDFKMSGFNMKDKEADEPSHKYLNERLAENDFDFLAAHFLRLDHMGHNVGLYNFDVQEAIEDIDQFLVHMMDSIDDNTMLIFGGDHGMTKAGGHGGGSPQETNTALVAYYKKGFMKNMHKKENFKKIMRSINETKAQVHQIDIVPTLSMLMGLPTPFSNMGQILNDLYPVGDYLTQQDCPDAAFEMQMLRDNHLNTLQVWNYFKKYHEGQDLFTAQEYSKISDLYQEVESAYKAANEMISQSQQCEASFHEAFITAILKSQQLSNQIHDLVSTKPPHDLVIFWQAFTILVLTGISYVLLVQYILKTKDYEHISLKKPKSWKSLAKTFIPLTILIALIWVFMLQKSPLLMRPFTASVLVLALWIIGSSIVSFISKSQEDYSENVPSTAQSEENRRPSTFSIKSFFLFQNPLVSAGAAAIIGYLFYLTHVFRLDKFYVAGLAHSNAPYVVVLLIGARIAGRYLKIAPYIMVGALLLAKVVNLTDWGFFWSDDCSLITALALVGDWLWGEAEFIQKKLKIGKVWSFHYVIGFIVLVCYHLIFDSDSEFVQIILPRVLWAIVIASSLVPFALKMPKKFFKRNLQINLILFLTLMQLHRKLLYFTIILSSMRVLTFIFKRTQFKNYLYPLFLGLLSYTGLFSLGFQDRKLPRNFEPAFVGIHDFHIALCLFLYSSAFLSTIILGMLFISFYSQGLELQEVELGTEKDESSCEVVALKGHANIIKKRNILLYSFFYCLIMIGAAINPVILKEHKKVYLSMERFLVDSVFFLFTINAVNLFV